MNNDPSEGLMTPGDTLVCTGDSITWEPGGYVDSVREILAARFPDDPPTVINAGVGSDTALQMLQRFDEDVLAHEPDLVSIMAGVADTVWQLVGRSDAQSPAEEGSEPDEFGQAVEEMTIRALDAGASVVLCTPTLFEENWGHDPSQGNRMIVAKTRHIERIAKEYGATIIPTAEVLRQAGDDAREAGRELHFTPDGFHPDEIGHALMTLAFVAALGYNIKSLHNSEPQE
ncbi:MAG: SGNH/GDSL hydrolase family protein [Armatimonadota bacterium]